MSERKLSDEQALAARTDEPRYSIRAAAGSGKTTVLVERYLRHVLHDGLGPHQILTITFTRKAAAEMKTRIVRRLRDLGRNDDAQIAETGPIQTIHSLCERLLRENALAARLDPEFDVLSGADREAMLETAIRQTLAHPPEAPEAQEMVLRLAGRQQYRRPPSLYAMLGELIRSGLEEVRGTGVDVHTFRARHRDATTTLEHWKSAILADLPEEIATRVQAAPPESLSEALKAAFKAERVAKPKWVTPVLPAQQIESARYATGLALIVADVWEAFEDRQEREQVFDFASLEARAVALLTGDLGVRRRVAQQFGAALVDEAQDVNPVQHALIDALGVPRSMSVGDPQQSIYGFRLADPALFRRRVDSGVCLPLSRNFRSKPGILRFVDDLFAELWGGAYMPMAPIEDGGDDPFGSTMPADYSGVELWSQTHVDHSQTVDWIEELLEEGWRPGQIAVLTETNFFALDLVDYLDARKIDWRIVGGAERFYTRLEVRDLANALTALVRPDADLALLSTLRSPVGGLSLDAVVLLAKGEGAVRDRLPDFKPQDPADAEALASFNKWFLPLADYADRLPAWEALAQVLRESDYECKVAVRPSARQTLANVRKLLSLAAAAPELGSAAFAERVREVQELRHREGDAPAIDDDAEAISLMTVHKSKGLEFDVVVLPQTIKSRRPMARPVVFDRNAGVLTACPSGSRNLAHNWLNDRRKDAEKEERLRLLYVAMTRAKQKLCVSVDPRGQASTLGGIVASKIGFRGEALPGLRVRGPKDDA